MVDQGLGLACAAVAIVFFGSNFTVTKKYPTGDGMFFQWVMCAAVWQVGLIVWLVRGADTHVFEPVALLGGVLWCLGNVWVVAIVQAIGLGLGLLIWGTANMLMGWASGRFGLFGLTKQAVAHPGLNTAGVLVAVVSLMLFIGVKPTVEEETKQPHQELLLEVHDSSAEGRNVHGNKKTWVERMPPLTRRIFGISMSVVSGILYGTNFDPPQYAEDRRRHSTFSMPRQTCVGDIMVNGTNVSFDVDTAGAPGSDNLLDYAFPHFCGIFLTSTVVLLIYCAVKGNKPDVYPEVILPGSISGFMWAIAQSSWFVANANLSFPVAFPIITIGPGLVGALWGVFVFGEIKGTRNYILLVSAFIIAITAGVMIALSGGTPADAPAYTNRCTIYPH